MFIRGENAITEKVKACPVLYKKVKRLKERGHCSKCFAESEGKFMQNNIFQTVISLRKSSFTDVVIII